VEKPSTPCPKNTVQSIELVDSRGMDCADGPAIMNYPSVRDDLSRRDIMAHATSDLFTPAEAAEESMSDILGIEQSLGVLATIKAELEAASRVVDSVFWRPSPLLLWEAFRGLGEFFPRRPPSKPPRPVFDRMTFGHSGCRNINIDSKSCARLWVGSSLA
jgi:hypothetical protein